MLWILGSVVVSPSSRDHICSHQTRFLGSEYTNNAFVAVVLSYYCLLSLLIFSLLATSSINLNLNRPLNTAKFGLKTKGNYRNVPLSLRSEFYFDVLNRLCVNRECDRQADGRTDMLIAIAALLRLARPKVDPRPSLSMLTVFVGIMWAGFGLVDQPRHRQF